MIKSGSDFTLGYHKMVSYISSMKNLKMYEFKNVVYNICILLSTSKNVCGRIFIFVPRFQRFRTSKCQSPRGFLVERARKEKKEKKTVKKRKIK